MPTDQCSSQIQRSIFVQWMVLKKKLTIGQSAENSGGGMLRHKWDIDITLPQGSWPPQKRGQKDFKSQRLERTTAKPCLLEMIEPLHS